MYHGLSVFLRLLREYVLCVSAILDLARSPEYHPDLSSFRCVADISPNLGVFYLHGRAHLVIGLESACDLVTTLDIVVCCNTPIRPESIHCTLVACGVKYVHLLATTLGITVHCNTAIRPEFVCCSATTVGIVIRCDTSITLESVRYVLAVIRILPICQIRFRRR